jgi:hypothetical protein
VIPLLAFILADGAPLDTPEIPLLSSGDVILLARRRNLATRRGSLTLFSAALMLVVLWVAACTPTPRPAAPSDRVEGVAFVDVTDEFDAVAEAARESGLMFLGHVPAKMGLQPGNDVALRHLR